MTEPLTPEIVDDDAHLPEIGKMKLTREQWQAFEAYCRAPTAREGREAAMGVAGVSRATFYRWEGSEWWAALWQIFVQAAHQDFQRDMHASAHKFSGALIDVADGTRKPDESPGASVNAALAYMKMGRTPLIDSRPQQVTNILNNSGEINLNKAGELSSDELLAIATGQKPMPEGL